MHNTMSASSTYPNSIGIHLLGASSSAKLRPKLLCVLTLIFVMLLAGGVGAVWAQEENELPRGVFLEEDPEALLSLEVGDAEVDLFVLGSWRSGIRGSYGIAIHPPLGPDGSRVTTSYPFPGFETIPFYNIVDLTISLWLYERFYFESTFADEFELRSILFGYQGRPGEFVQEVKVGNAPLSISEYPYIDIGEGTENAPGASALFETSRSSHEALLRYESSGSERMTFIGMNELREERIEPGSYIRGRFFVLPDGDVEDLRLYLEDATGSIVAADGRRYRQADLDAEAVVSRSAGTLQLREAAAGQVVVSYTKGGLPVGTGGVGLGEAALVGPLGADEGALIDPDVRSDFSFGAGDYYGLDLGSLETTVDGRQSLVLYRPGAFNPFEVQRYYETETDPAADSDTLFVRRGGLREVSFAPVRAARLDAEVDALEVIAPDEPGMDPRAAAFRYPFLGTEPEAPRLYGPRPQRTPGSTSFEILVRGLRPVSALSLGSDIVPGTVRVQRNGATDNSFTVDYRTGRLETPLPINPSDVIEVSFRSYSGGGIGGDLLFAFGNRFQVTDNLDAALALGLRWHLLGAPYSTEPNQHPGAVTLSGELDYRGTNLDLLLDGAVSLQVPDTTGYLRLLGMEGNEQRLGVRDHTVVPAAPPGFGAADEGDYIDPSGDASNLFALGTLTQDNRGRLIYRDFRRSEGLGTPQLQDYTWSPPSSQTYAYEDGGRIGPYTALARGDGIDGQVMVMEFDIDPSEPNTPLWVGAQMRPPNFADLDLSQVGRVEIEWYVPDDLGGNVEVYLQLGALEEDLDGDGSLDRGSSRLQPQFPFRDAGRGIELLAGDGIPGAVFVNSEDGNRNEVLDAEAPGQIITRRLAASNAALPTAGWRRDIFNLGPTERARLSRVRGARIIVVHDSGTAAEGRLLVSELRFLGGSIPVEVVDAEGRSTDDPPAGRNVRAYETGDPKAGAEALHRVFPDVRNVFHSEGLEAQRVLRVDWDNIDIGTGESVLLQQPVPATPWDHYRSLRFYLLIDDAALVSEEPDAEIEIELLDPAGGGVRAVLPLSELPRGSWNEVTLDLLRKRLEVNGNTVAPLALDRGRRSERLSLLRLQIRGAEGGTLYIDEVHWAEAQSSIEGTASASLEYRIPGTLIERGGFPLLGNVVLNEDITVQSAGYGLESERVAGVGLFQSRSGVAADVVGTRLETDLELFTDQERWSGAGGHRLQVPARPGPVSFTDRYRRSYDSLAPSMSRGNSLRLRRAGVGSLLLESEAILVSERLDQVWGVADNTSDELVSWIFDGSLRLRNRTSTYELPDTDYFSSWVDAYELLLPNTDRETARRSGTIRRRFGYRPDPLGFDAVLEGGYENSSVFDGRQRTTLLLRAGPAFSFETAQRTRYRVSPSYGRTASGSYPAPNNRDFADDLSVYGDSLGEIPYFFSSIPFYELIQDRDSFEFAEATEGLPFARYRPELGIQFERSFGSRLRDLYVPSNAALTVDRELLRREDSLTDTRGINLSLESVALNLFGSLGAYPLTQRYESDELSNRAEYSLRHREPDSTTLQRIRLENTTRFFASGDRTLSLDSLLQFEIEEYFRREVAGRARYEWRIYPDSLFGIRRLDPLVERGAFIRNTERITLSERRNEQRPERDLLTIVFGHESKLEIPDRGAVRVYLDLGVGREPFNVEDGDVVNQTLLGVQGGIEAVIEY